MALFLLKSTACMAILWIFYKLLLEKETMHVFKRFYLLGALAASFIIPSLVFTEYIEMALVEISPQLPVDGSFDNTATDPPVAPEPATFNYQILLWVLYGLGVFGFGLRFARHLSQIWHRIRKNPKLRKNFIIQVLLQEQLPPHTFFNYIFLNKKKFDNNEIPETVLLHEETHAKQKHSIDVLALELLQVLLWFNPFIYLYKHAAKLNHEFLADTAVLNKSKNLLQYQNTLLSYLSHDSYIKHQSTGISSAINYSSIKKRFIIMKKRTSKKGVVLRSLLLLPLMGFLLANFSEKSIEYIDSNSHIENALTLENSDKSAVRTIRIAGLVLDSETLNPLEGVEIKDSNGRLLSKTDRKGYYRLHIDDHTTDEIYFNLFVEKNGYKPMVQQEHWGNLNGVITSTFYLGLQKLTSESPEFSKLFTDNGDLSYSSIYKNKIHIEKELTFNQKLENTKRKTSDIVIEVDGSLYLVSSTGWLKLNSPNDIIAVNDNTNIIASNLNGYITRSSIKSMSPLEDYDNSDFAIYTTSGDINDNLDNRAIKTYNRLAKKYNAVSIEKRIIPLKDLKILEKIYRKMSASQKKSAQPFPECNIQGTIKEIDIKVHKDGLLLIDSQLLQVDELKEHLKSMNTPKTYEERQKSLRVLITSENDAPKDVLQKIDQIVSEFGAATVNIYGKKVGFQEPPTTKQIKEYNDLANKYNSMIAKGGNIRILKSDVDRLRYIYNLMSDKQKKDAAPFPDFPEPPPAPKAPDTPNSVDYTDAEIEKIINNKDIIAVENTQVYIHNSNFIESDRSPNLMKNLKSLAKQDAQFYLDGKKITTEEGFSVVNNEKDITIETLPYTNKQPEVRIYKEKDNIKIPPPPSPPTPISPLDFVIDAAKKGATFLYEDKEVSSDKAIDLIKNNKELNIESRGKNGNTVIKITKDPVTIE